jgi:sulfane dehydrogenase subunit SoxC
LPIRFEADVVRRHVPWLTGDPILAITFTPIHALGGTITPQGCASNRHHSGAIELPKGDDRLMINGLVKLAAIIVEKKTRRPVPGKDC